MQQNNEILQIFLGFLLLIGMHTVAITIIFVLGLLIGQVYGQYSFLYVWMIGGMGFLFWQLLYVIPLVISLRRRQRTGMMKGVIICAVITALLNGTCALYAAGIFEKF